MKSFDVKLLDTTDAPIVASVAGHGKLEFEVVEADTGLVIGLRKRFVSLYAEINDAPDDEANAAAYAVMFKMACELVKNTVVPKMTDEQALRLVPLAGGHNGDLVRQLAVRFGVFDMLARGDGEDDKGLEDELPT